MPANNTNAKRLEDKYPGRMGWLFSPGSWQDPGSLTYALDNGRFSVWSKGKDWSESDWRKLVDKAANCDTPPRWVAIPDVVEDADATFDEWNRWNFQVPKEWKLALVVQDGMTPDSVRKRCYPQPDVIFVGGTSSWKIRTLWNWCREFPRVHVGRVNGEKWLWNAHRCGAESCDGTGWFRGDQRQLRGLLRYLKRSSNGIDIAQLELEFASPDLPKAP